MANTVRNDVDQGMAQFRKPVLGCCGATTDATSRGCPVVSVGCASWPPSRIDRGYQRAIRNCSGASEDSVPTSAGRSAGAVLVEAAALLLPGTQLRDDQDHWR